MSTTTTTQEALEQVWCFAEDFAGLSAEERLARYGSIASALSPAGEAETVAAAVPEVLRDAAEAFLEAESAFDNRELVGMNSEPCDVLRRRLNSAREGLELALAATPAPAPAAAQAETPHWCKYCEGKTGALCPRHPDWVAPAEAVGADHVPVSPEEEASIDAAVGLFTLPPIRVSRDVARLLNEAAASKGLILQAHVRDLLLEAVGAQRAEVPMPTNEDQAAAMSLVGEAWLREHAPHRLRAGAVRVWKNETDAWWHARSQYGVAGQGLSIEDAFESWKLRNPKEVERLLCPIDAACATDSRSASVIDLLGVEVHPDTARLNWIAEHWFYKDSGNNICFNFNEAWDAGRHDDLRAAIDADRAITPPAATTTSASEVGND